MDFKDNSPAVRAAFEKAIPRALTACGIQGMANCQLELENHPRRIDTGRLRASINSRVSGKTANIGTNVEYGIYVHEGTRKMEANRFLRNGVEKHADDYYKIIEMVFKNTQV